MGDQPNEILTIEEVAAFFRRGNLEKWIGSRVAKAPGDDEGAE